LSEETVQEITLPDDATPASIVGETDLMPGQELLNRTAVLAYARQMQRGEFPWQAMQEEQPMAVEVGTNGKVITQGHHRYVAARLAGNSFQCLLNIDMSSLSRGWKSRLRSRGIT
jgi:hypothetical protein